LCVRERERERDCTCIECNAHLQRCVGVGNNECLGNHFIGENNVGTFC
jgi:hypothetical protein